MTIDDAKARHRELARAGRLSRTLDVHSAIKIYKGWIYWDILDKHSAYNVIDIWDEARVLLVVSGALPPDFNSIYDEKYDSTMSTQELLDRFNRHLSKHLVENEETNNKVLEFNRKDYSK